VTLSAATNRGARDPEAKIEAAGAVAEQEVVAEVLVV
jgi:hypothetical protein